MWGTPRWLSGKESTCQFKRHEFGPWVRKIPWRKKWQPTSVLLPGKFHGQRSLVGYSPWGGKELDTTERLSTQALVAPSCSELDLLENLLHLLHQHLLLHFAPYAVKMASFLKLHEPTPVASDFSSAASSPLSAFTELKSQGLPLHEG